MKRRLLIILFLFLNIPKPAFAADIASSYKIDDTAAVAGDILVSGSEGIIRASQEYDQRIFGILVDTAVVVIRSVDETYKPVVRSGETIVNVTSANGPIKKGDFITTSKTTGKGQKATISGYVIGLAMEDLSGDSGAINVSVRIEYTEISNARTLSRLFDMLTAGLFKNISDQGQFPMVLRYIIVGLVMLTCIFISFFTFSRSVPKAIEAVGRNPLARSSILLSLALSIGLVIGTIALGLLASIVILKI